MIKITTLSILTLSIFVLGLPSAHAINQYVGNNNNQGFAAVDEQPQAVSGSNQMVVTFPTKRSDEEDDPCKDELDGFESGDTSAWSYNNGIADETECPLAAEEEEDEDPGTITAAPLLIPHF